MPNDHPLISPPGNRPNVNENVLLWNIFLALTGGVPGAPVVPVFSGGGSSTPVTPNISNIGASAGANIPAGAKGYSFSLLTGTGTLDGVAITAPITIGDQNTLAVAVPYTTGSASSALLYYNT